MKELKEKIYDYLAVQDNDFKTALIGGLHYYENIEKEPTYPYAVYQLVYGSLDRDTGSKFENPVVQITIYDNSSSSVAISQLGEQLDARFDESENAFSLAKYYVLGIDRVTTPREERTYQGDWQWSADYKIQLQTK